MEDRGGSTIARRTVLGLFAGGAAALLGGCRLLGGNSYRFKMTVDVETPQGLRTGSSVYEVTAFKTSELIAGGTSSDSTVKGEAAAVDLPGGRTLFALLKTINPMRDDLALMSMAALDPAFSNNRVESTKRIAFGDGIRSPNEVVVSDYPLLVNFRDLSAPHTVERIDAANLAATFGPDYRLRRIMVQVTDEPVTTGIVKRLTWLPEHRGTLKPNPPRTMNDPSDPDLRLLGTKAFSTELLK